MDQTSSRAPAHETAAAPVAATASARATVDAAARAVLGAPQVGARAAAIDTLARTIWGEARGEPRDGKEAVAAVILNRLTRGPARRFGDTLEACCRMPRHFSCWNEGDPNRAKLLAVTEDDPAFRECIEIATLAIDGQLHDRTDGCDHYHTTRVHPSWSRGKEPKVAIGSHLFFDDIA